MKLSKLISAEEISQIQKAVEDKNSIYDKIKSMVMGWSKPRPRQRKPLSKTLEGSLDYLYSMGIYRDWVMKQSTEEGIARQEKINEKNIEDEACLQFGIRSSARLNPTESNEDEKISEIRIKEKEYSEDSIYHIDQEDSSSVLSPLEEYVDSKQKIPKCVQKLLIGILNINTLTAYKLEEVMKMYIIQDFDIIALVDTRITKREENAYNAIIRRCQRSGDYHKYFDLKDHNEGPGAKKVGGMLFLMSSRCGVMVNTFELGEGLEVYSEVTHKVGAILLTTSATYWPSK